MAITRHVYTSAALRFFPLEEIIQGCLQSVVKIPFRVATYGLTDLLKPFYFSRDKKIKLKSRMLFFCLEKQKRHTLKVTDQLF